MDRIRASQWLVWVLGVLAVVAVVAAAGSLVAARAAEREADEAEAALAEAGGDLEELQEEIARNEERRDSAQEKARIARQIIRPGAAADLGAFYLTVGAQICDGAGPFDLEKVIVEAAQSGDYPVLNEIEDWQTAIDREALRSVASECGADLE